MATNYPNNLDSDLELPGISEGISEIGGDTINALKSAVLSIQKTLGINPQGNSADLVTRIDNALDSNGNILSAAISAHGLVSLPITNAHIGSTAGIIESKLDLDYATSYLNAIISSLSTDVDALRISHNALSTQVTEHVTAVDYRHDGYDIDLSLGIRSSDDVETALHVLDNDFVDHQNSTSGAHNAYGVSVSNEFDTISATNVQDALFALDKLDSDAIETHQDQMHRSGIVFNTRAETGVQGNLNITTLAGTIYQTDTTKATNVLQVMRPNVARVTGTAPDLRSLAIGSAQYLRIQAGGCGRGTLDVNLASVIPTNSIDDIVATINTAAHSGTEHYPISAYNICGRLTIAHNIPGQPFTIQILGTISASAHSVLGFDAVSSTTYYWSGLNNAAYVGGAKVIDCKSLIKKYHTHAGSATISLGLGNLATYGITTGNTGRLLCNITSHSSNVLMNGTYYILSFPTASTFILSESVDAGSFNIEISADSVSFENSSNGELFDIFAEADEDGYATITKSNRITYGVISGVSLRSVNEDFPDQMEWQVSDTNHIQLHRGSSSGVSVDIPTGFIGQLQVFAPDNVNSALFEVTGSPSSHKRTMTVYDFAGTDDRLHIGSVHYSGNYGLYTLKFFTDKRFMGLAVDNKTEDLLSQTPLEETIGELRNNGVIRGLDVLSSTSNSFKLRGGKALVDGRIVNVETQDIILNDFTNASNLLLLDRYGNFVIKNEYDAGYTFEELTDGDAYGDTRNVAIICEFNTNGEEIDGYFVDRRLMVSNIDKRLVDAEASLQTKIQRLESTTAGSMWANTVVEYTVIGGSFIGTIATGSNSGFTYVPEVAESCTGFSGGVGTVTERRFEFSSADTLATSIFRARGLTHINIFVTATFTGTELGGPFGTSGVVYLDLGAEIEQGIDSVSSAESYARVRTFQDGVLTSNIYTERYAASIPISQFSVAANSFFDIAVRIKIVNSTLVDGGDGVSPDHQPTMAFDDIRIVTSSYSIVGDIDGLDGSSASLGTVIGDIL